MTPRTVPSPDPGRRLIRRIDVHVRWMIRRDLMEVVDIERQSFRAPWDEAAVLRLLRRRSAIGMVAELGDRVVGFMLYEHRKDRIHLRRLAVHPAFRARGVGTQLVTKLSARLTHRRPLLTLKVRETNAVAVAFYRARGFHATGLDHGYYPDTGEDAYRFQITDEEARRCSRG